MHTWRKIGQIYNAEAVNENLLSHASNPLAIRLRDSVYRIFFSGRNIENKSSVGYFDFNLDSLETINICKAEVIKFGDNDSFFSHGISIGNAYCKLNDTYILFMGWQIRDDSHWRGEIGKLKLVDTEKLIPDPNEVFLKCDEEDGLSLSYPWVLFEDSLYHMWYGSTISWTSENGEMIHVIKHATSRDGEKWTKHGLAVPYEVGVAQAFSRPTVVKDNIGYHMWFSFRSGSGTKYRIGYANSLDGQHWIREDDSGITVSDSGWDSEMLCYPFVFDHNGSRYMLYNGNGYGKTGIGLAVLE